MPYCTRADLAMLVPPETLRQLASDDPQATAPDPAIIDAALAYADARIDAALASAGVRLPVPPDPPPAILRELAAGLARAWLYARRPEGMDYPEAQRRQAEAHEKLLAEIASRRLRLGLPDTPNPRVPGLTSLSSSARVFGRERTGGY